MNRSAWGAVFLALCGIGFAANVALLAVNLSLTAQHVADPPWMTVSSFSAFGFAAVVGVGSLATGRRAGHRP